MAQQKTAQPAQMDGTMLDYCWSTVSDAGPIINHHWAISCLLLRVDEVAAEASLSYLCLFVPRAPSKLSPRFFAQLGSSQEVHTTTIPRTVIDFVFFTEVLFFTQGYYVCKCCGRGYGRDTATEEMLYTHKWKQWCICIFTHFYWHGWTLHSSVTWTNEISCTKWGNEYIKYICVLECSHQTRYVDPMLVWCWPTVYDAGPTLNYHRVNISCLLDCN